MTRSSVNDRAAGWTRPGSDTATAPASPAPVERLIARSREDERAAGALSDRARQAQRSVESYLKAGARPRWMDRVAEIDRRIAAERERLAVAYARLLEQCGDDPGAFAQRWTRQAEAADYRDLNELVAEHNEWYPIERDLPMDPRTRDYVRVHGRSHRRPLLDARWVLEQFPADRPF